jgi:hypothetical protein
VAAGFHVVCHVACHALKSNWLVEGLGWGIFGQEGLI